MLSAVAVLVVLLTPAVVLVALLLAIEQRSRARADVVARQIMLTDAIHAELGAVVAPTVRRLGNGWRLAIPVPFDDLGTVTRVVATASRAFDAAEQAAPARFELVLSPQERPSRHAARVVAPMARPTRGESVSWT